MPADIAKLRELAGRLEHRSKYPAEPKIQKQHLAEASAAILSLLDEMDRKNAALGEAETALRGVWAWSEEDAKGLDAFVEEDVLATLKTIRAALSDETGI